MSGMAAARQVFVVGILLCLYCGYGNGQALRKHSAMFGSRSASVVGKQLSLLNDREAVAAGLRKGLELLKLRYSGNGTKASVWNSNSSESCEAGWEYLRKHWSINDVNINVSLAYQAIDASGKLESGILEGNVLSFGSYDECLAIDRTEYCLVPVTLEQDGKLVLPLQTAMCLPEECTNNDITNTLTDLSDLLGVLRLNVSLKTDPGMIECESRKKLPYNAGAIVMIVVCVLFAVLSLIGTTFDWLLSLQLSDSVDMEEKKLLLSVNSSTTPRKRPVVFQLITAFSLFQTVPAILSTNQPPAAITCIHGIRTISMFWVILGHTNLWSLLEQILSNTASMFKHVTPRFSYQPIANGFVAVDSFFFLSGLLLTYLTLRHMSRKRGRFPAITYYVHRYLRLTPSYAFVLFFFWFLTMHLTNGPRYHAGTNEHSNLYHNCEKYWWTNLLYINNLYPWKLNDECMGWSWYLSNDMQFFVISPLFIILLYYSPIIAMICIGIVLTGSFAITAAITGYYGFDSGFQGMSRPPSGTTVTYQDEIYIKPYARIAPYLVGIILGYLFYKKVKVPFGRLFNWLFYGVVWAVATALGIAVVYGLYSSWHGHDLTLGENIMYTTFSRFTWGIALALMVFACHNGYGGIINSFLSMKLWIPLSRLTFNAYLVHEIVLTVMFGNLRDSFYYTDITISVYTIAAVVLSYGSAGIIAAFIEFPLGTVEATVFKIFGLSARESTRQGNHGKLDTTDNTEPPDKVSKEAY